MAQIVDEYKVTSIDDLMDFYAEINSCFIDVGKVNEKLRCVIEENKRKLKWFKDNKIIINIKPFSKKIKGESIKNRLIVFIFDMLNKTGLIRIFSIIYCRR